MDTTNLQEAAQQKTAEWRDTAMNLAGKAKGRARDAGAAADLYVHEYAWTSLVLVGIAAIGIGFLLGRSR